MTLAGRPAGRASPWGRLTVLAVLVAAGSVVAVVVGLPDVQQLRTEVAAAGAAGPVVFALLYAAASLAPLPKGVLSAAAGLLFGLVSGVVLVWTSSLVGALGAFALARALGREAVERLTGARTARVDAVLGRRGLLAVLVARLVPVLPFTVVNYGAGLSAVRLRDYLVGTALGIVPGTVAYVALGAYGTSPGSWPFLGAVGALLALTAGAAVAGPRLRRRGRAADLTSGGGAAAAGRPPRPS